ncbi:uncharacterized protein LOC112564704 [Pomacea canaliculata]|nr:uncharacterized protein LOC112564704 [Pomacea canaliculata]
MLVYDIIAALRTRSDWEKKFVDALREAEQTEALRIIGEDIGANLDPNERRGDRPEYSVSRSSPSACESFSQRAGNALNQGSCRQTEPARQMPGCSCTRQHSSADVAQGLLAESLDSLKLINQEQNVRHERLDAGHALQGGPACGAEGERNNILPQQSRNCTDSVTIPAHSRLPTNPDMMSTPQSNSVGHENSSMASNTQLSEEDNTQQNWNLNHDYQDENKFSDKEVNDTEEDCGPSTNPVDSNHSNQSHDQSVESAQNDDLGPSLPQEVANAIAAGHALYQ